MSDKTTEPGAIPIWQINDWMRDVGWQNCEIRQVDLPRVAQVVQLALGYAAPSPLPRDPAGMMHYGWRKVFSNEFRSAGEDWQPPEGDRQWIPVYVRLADLQKEWEPKR